MAKWIPRVGKIGSGVPGVVGMRDTEAFMLPPDTPSLMQKYSDGYTFYLQNRKHLTLKALILNTNVTFYSCQVKQKKAHKNTKTYFCYMLWIKEFLTDVFLIRRFTLRCLRPRGFTGQAAQAGGRESSSSPRRWWSWSWSSSSSTLPD